MPTADAFFTGNAHFTNLKADNLNTDKTTWNISGVTDYVPGSNIVLATETTVTNSSTLLENRMVTYNVSGDLSATRPLFRSMKVYTSTFAVSEDIVTLWFNLEIQCNTGFQDIRRDWFRIQLPSGHYAAAGLNNFFANSTFAYTNKDEMLSGNTSHGALNNSMVFVGEPSVPSTGITIQDDMNYANANQYLYFLSQDHISSYTKDSTDTGAINRWCGQISYIKA